MTNSASPGHSHEPTFILPSCNDWPIESRLIPAVLFFLLVMTIWRLQKRQGPMPMPATVPSSQRVMARATALALLYAGLVWFTSTGIGPWPVALLCLAPMVAWIEWAYSLHPPEAKPCRQVTWAHLAPAICALGTAIAIVACLFSSNFVGHISDARLSKMYAIVATYTPHANGHELGERAMHGVTMALTLVAATAATWFTAGLWWDCQSRRFAWGTTGWILLETLAISLILGLLGLAHVIQGLDSAYGNAMLCASWERGNAAWMAMFSDANNVLGIYVPVIIGTGICLLLEPVGTLNSGTLEAIAKNSRRLDSMLYVGATCLALGILHMSAVYASALAPLPSMASVKARSEFCKKTMVSPAAASAANPVRQGNETACAELEQDAQAAEVIDSAREFAKTTTLAFGISFSAVLAAMYVPALLLLKRAADEYTQVIAGGTPLSKAQQAAEYVALGIESDLLGKFGKVIAALSPIFAGVLANALGSIG